MRALSWSLLTVFLVCSTSALGQTIPHRDIVGVFPDERFGAALATAGDLNGDGVADVVVGAPSNSTVATWAGAAGVYSGADGATLMTFHGDTAASQFGHAVAGVGDVDGDGYPDVAIGAPLDDDLAIDAGSVTVHSGRDGSIISTIQGGTANDNLGFSVAGLGDLDGDGRAEIAVGMPGNADGGPYAGSVRIYSGMNGAILFDRDGSHGWDWLGYAVANAGDVDGDGLADLLVGIPGDDTIAWGAGAARVYSTATFAVLFEMYGPSAGAAFGGAVTGAGDVDGDGLADVAVGSRNENLLGLGSAGAVRIYSQASTTPLQVHLGDVDGGMMGQALSGGFDIDGDGHPDLVVGIPGDNTVASRAGKIVAFSGADGSVLHACHGDAAQYRLGSSVALLPSVDGFADFATGAVMEQVGTSPGLVRIYDAPTRPVLEYRSALPLAHGIDADWLPDGGDPESLTGSIVCTGATPGGLGLYGLSLARIDYSAFGYLPLLIANDPFNLIETGSFGFDITGTVTIQGASRQAPAIAGTLVYLQFFETSPIIAGSSGLRFLTAP